MGNGGNHSRQQAGNPNMVQSLGRSCPGIIACMAAIIRSGY
jgi:hypothetical protein